MRTHHVYFHGAFFLSSFEYDLLVSSFENDDANWNEFTMKTNKKENFPLNTPMDGN